MPTVLKPFGAKVTDSPRDRFLSARAQLTLTYTAILAVILFISSSIIYSAFSNRLAQRFERFPPRQQMVLPEGVIPPRAEDVLTDLTYALLLVNGLLLVLAAVLSYWLAGITLEPIRETYERQRRFLSDASHELRTPLAILQADLENARSEPSVTQKTLEQTESYLEEVERMSTIVRDLLFLSRLDETVSAEEPLTKVNLNSLLRATVDRFTNLAKKHHVFLDYTSSQTDLVFQTRASLLAHAIDNLLKNAILYNVNEGKVHVHLEKDASQARIRIEDTGIGISPEHVDKIFERFYRVDKSRSRQTGGSGLGLAITRSVIEQLHGSLQLKSELGKGTQITILLPLS